MNDDMRSAEPMEIRDANDLENKIPLYPEPLLEDNAEFDMPKYSGDLDDLMERRNVKLYNLWACWSDLRKNERLINMLEVKKTDKDDTKYLKAMMTITIDRLGKVLADTNIVEELCVKTARRSEAGDTPSS